MIIGDVAAGEPAACAFCFDDGVNIFPETFVFMKLHGGMMSAHRWEFKSRKGQF